MEGSCNRWFPGQPQLCSTTLPSNSSSFQLASPSPGHLWFQVEDNSPFRVATNRLGIEEVAVQVPPGMTVYNNWRCNDSGSNHSSSKAKQCQLAKKKENKGMDVDKTSKCLSTYSHLATTDEQVWRNKSSSIESYKCKYMMNRFCNFSICIFVGTYR